MKQNSIDKGVLALFRIILFYRLSVLIYEGFFISPTSSSYFKSVWQSVGLISADLFFIFALFALSRYPTQARRFFPYILGFSTIPIFIETYLLTQSYHLTSADLNASFGPLPLSVDLILWTVIVAWQYRLSAVIAFELFVALVDFGLLNWFASADTEAYRLTIEEMIFRAVVHLTIGYIITRLVNHLREQNQKLIAANNQLAHYATTVEKLAITEERNRLARELHDTLAHSLTGLTIQLEAATSLWERDLAMARHLVYQANETAHTGAIESRRALNALRATPLEEVGLYTALTQIIEKFSDLSVQLTLPSADAFNLSPIMEQTIFRIAQEALENVRRHAHAEHITVTLQFNTETLSLMVQDDGSGFDPTIVTHRWGLQGMKERAMMLGGTLEITTLPAKGTTVLLTIPYERGGDGN